MIRVILQAVSWAAFVSTVVPACLYLNGTMGLDTMKHATMAATVVWFAATPFWMGRKGGEKT
jgi:hypothetical protein